MLSVENTTHYTITIFDGIVIRPGLNTVPADPKKLANLDLVKDGRFVIVPQGEAAPTADFAVAPKKQAKRGKTYSPSELLAAANAGGAESGALERLLSAGQDAIADYENRKKIASIGVLDPATPEDRVAILKQEVSDLQTSSDRMAAALARVQTRLHEVREAESAAARQIEYASALAERDQLVIDLGECPVLMSKLAELLDRLKKSNHRIATLASGKWRSDETPIKDAESIARGFTSASPFGVGQIGLMHKVSLPHFAANKASPTGTLFGPPIGSY